ncbi:bestrophin-2a-like isoform X2 [Antedon mediterranea]|uniref:bestrophin-2a-like isoform X2 n=1 Tax=Antedon mediterranea TaxID=105859 RepID=UPI003AF5B395
MWEPVETPVIIPSKNIIIRTLSKLKLGGFLRLLLRWKASVYKLLWREMLIFLFLYTIVSVTYRYALTGSVKTTFEKLAIYSNEYTRVFPISFVLGFYVTVIFDRWWRQYLVIPWPDRVAYNVAAHILGSDEEGRILRRTMVRYINLAGILIYRVGSKRVKKRFPTLAHLVEAGLMTEEEKSVFKKLQTNHPRHWLPCVWFITLARKARKEGRIISDPAMKTIIDEVNAFHDKCEELYGFDWIMVPLVYTQVVTIATYSYFAACLFGRQYLDQAMSYEGHEIDLKFPGFTLLEFIFYVGWLKVAENLMNPFGEDDDDFDMNWIIDRNIQVGYLAVDDFYECDLPLVKDLHYSVQNPILPYTRAANSKKGKPWQGSADKVRIARKDMIFTNMPAKLFSEDDEVYHCELPPPTSVPTSSSIKHAQKDYQKEEREKQKGENDKQKEVKNKQKEVKNKQKEEKDKQKEDKKKTESNNTTEKLISQPPQKSFKVTHSSTKGRGKGDRKHSSMRSNPGERRRSLLDKRDQERFRRYSSADILQGFTTPPIDSEDDDMYRQPASSWEKDKENV